MVLFEAGMVGRHIGGVFGFGLCAALAMSAGIGGGGLFVPLLMILLGKDAKQATAMSQCLIAGAAIAGTAYNLKQRHPSRDRPLINVGAVVFLAPLQMGGALLGNMLNQIMPKYLIIILMITVLSFSAFKTLRKGISLWKEEALGSRGNDLGLGDRDIELSDMSESLTGQNAGDQEYDSWKLFTILFKMKLAIKRRKASRMTYVKLEQPSTGSHSLHAISMTDDDQITRMTSVIEPLKTAGEFVEVEKRHSLKHWSLLAGVWLTTVVLVLARGGKGAGSLVGVEYCGPGYWGLSAFALVVLFLLSLYVMQSNVEETTQKQACKYEFATGDIVWTRSTGVRLCLGTLFAGIVAGLIGIGGGMVIGPFLLDIGVIPQVSSAITATNVLLSSSTLAILVMSSGLVEIDESLFFFGCCLLGAYLGKFYLGKVLKAFGRTSLIILILGGVITMCILVVFVMGLTSWVTTNALEEPFASLCS